MPKIDASGYRYAIAASRFNKELVDALVRDAVETLHGCGVDAENVRLVRVPGAAELPHVCNMLAQTEQYDAIIALGAIGGICQFPAALRKIGRDMVGIALVHLAAVRSKIDSHLQKFS